MSSWQNNAWAQSSLITSITATTNATNAEITYYAQPTQAQPRTPESDLDWLRARVNEVCELAA